jgi:hypothetical protein
LNLPAVLRLTGSPIPAGVDRSDLSGISGESIGVIQPGNLSMQGMPGTPHARSEVHGASWRIPDPTSSGREASSGNGCQPDPPAGEEPCLRIDGLEGLRAVHESGAGTYANGENILSPTDRIL